MVPAAYVALEALPLTPNGKVDRKALPAPDDSAYARRTYEAPQGEVEQTLAQIWSEVLRVERVGRHDNFFELGGHSLLVVRVIDRMRAAGLHADIRTLFTASTLVALAGTVRREAQTITVPANAIVAGTDTITPEMLPLVAVVEFGRRLQHWLRTACRRAQRSRYLSGRAVARRHSVPSLVGGRRRPVRSVFGVSF